MKFGAITAITLLFALSIAAQTDGKKNGRPQPVSPAKVEMPASFVPTYFYEFSRPGFIYSEIRIKHDDAGKGTIAFKRDAYDEFYEDPIDLGQPTVEKIKAAYAALNFLDSTDDYQTKMDHSNMGNITLTQKRGGRERQAKFNWTDNKDAKTLMDLYRAITNEYTWRFEVILARQTQPLMTPALMDQLDEYLRRGEISDPARLLPFLTELSTDERLPLMARNHAAKLIKQAERTVAK